jgi:hypothetical protein
MRTPYFGNPKNAAEKFQLRSQATDFIRQRGTSQPPNPPRDPIGQSAPRGVFVTWGLPPGDSSQITGWRVYSPDENSLVGSISDRGTRQFTVPATAGSSPPIINIFITAVNALGLESSPIQVQGKATAESGAPSQPATPPGFSSGTGSDTSRVTGSISRDSSGAGLRSR